MPKDKTDITTKKQPKKMQLPQKNQGRIATLGARFWKGIAAFVVLAGLFDFVRSFRPLIEVNLDKSLDVSDPFATRFDVINAGRLDVENVQFICEFDAGPNLRNLGTTDNYRVAKVLRAGDQLVRDCEVRAPEFPLNTVLTASATYTYPLLGKLTQTNRFLSQKDVDGKPQWFKSTD